MNASPHNIRDKSFLPERYQPSSVDVICARGIKSFYHCGNKSFRKAIAENLEMYGASSDKRSKSMIVSSIANEFYFNGDERKRCRFIRFCDSKKLWYEISYDLVRQKVGQTMRDTLLQQDPQRLSRKKQSRARRASSRHCISSNANRHMSHSVEPTSTQQEEHEVHSSPCGHLFCLTVPLSNQVSSTDQHSRQNVIVPGQGQLLCDLVLVNLEWATSAGNGALMAANTRFDCRGNALDSDTSSVSSCQWFQECDETSLSNCDWLESDHEKIWT